MGSRRFVKFYDKGIARVESLLELKGGPTVGKLWLFLVKMCGHENALVASSELLASHLGVTDRSIRRAAALLAASGAVVIAKVGNANCYILNDDEVWKTAEDHHRFCGFRAKALIGFDENPSLRARLTHLEPKPEAKAKAKAKRAKPALASAEVADSGVIEDDRQVLLAVAGGRR